MNAELAQRAEKEIASAEALYGPASLQVAACLERNADLLREYDAEAANELVARAQIIRENPQQPDGSLDDLVDTSEEALWRPRTVSKVLVNGIALTLAMVLIAALASAFGMAVHIAGQLAIEEKVWIAVRLASIGAALSATATTWYWLLFCRTSRGGGAAENEPEPDDSAESVGAPEQASQHS